MQDSLGDPEYIVGQVEHCALLSNVVEFGEKRSKAGAIEVLCWADILVEESFGHEWPGREEHVVACNVVVIVDSLP